MTDSIELTNYRLKAKRAYDLGWTKLNNQTAIEKVKLLRTAKLNAQTQGAYTT